MTGALTFLELWRRWADCPSHARSLAFGSLSQAEQNACWRTLAAEARDHIEIENAVYLGPARREQRSGADHSTATSRSTCSPTTSAGAALDATDALKRIPAVQYLPALAGVVMSSAGRCRCPMPDHLDEHPSAKAYGARWECFSCGARGDIYELGSALYGLEQRGGAFIELRRRIADALLKGGHRA